MGYFPSSHLAYPLLTLMRVAHPYQFLVLSIWPIVKLHMSTHHMHVWPCVVLSHPSVHTVMSQILSYPGITRCQASAVWGRQPDVGSQMTDSDRHVGCHS